MINKISVSFSGLNRTQQILQDINLFRERETFLPNVVVEEKKQAVVEPPKGYVPPYKIDPSIYAIDKDGNYTKFASQIEASKILGITAGCISRCINFDAGKTGSYVIVSALDVEKLDKDGNVVVNEAKIQNLSKKIFTEKAYYVIDENGSFNRYSSLQEAREQTGVEQDSFTKSHVGYRQIVGNKCFVRAEDIEDKKIDGSPVLDVDKLITVFIGNKHAFYAVDKKGNATLFHSHSQAGGKIGATSNAITSCLSGKNKNVGSYTYARPTQVLGINDKNQIVVDDKKIKALLAERFGK